MLHFSCLSCASALQSETGTSLCECPVCGIQQAVPVGLNPEMMSLYIKSCDALRDGAFFDAFEQCEEILNVFPDHAPTHWLAVLARYGVEYVRRADDNKPRAESGLLNIVRVTSALHYMAALSSADAELTAYFEENAALIDSQQMHLRDAALRAPIYDAFIVCLPAGDDSVSREDRLAAMHLYQRLVKNGLRVYLRGVNGDTNEACVFSALHSAKMMFVVGSHLQALNDYAVRSDWKRYIQISCETQRGQLVVLHDKVPLDEIPLALSSCEHCCYRNNNALGSYIRKVTELARRAPLQEDFGAREEALTADAIAQQFDVAMQLREKQEKKAALFEQLCAGQRTAETQKDFELLAQEFRRMADYKDAAERASACSRKAELHRFEKMQAEETQRLLLENRRFAQEKEAAAKKSTGARKKQYDRMIFTGVTALFVAVCTCIILFLTQLVFPYFDYRSAQKELAAGNVEEAMSVYEQLDGFMDSEEQYSVLREAMDATVPTDPFALARIR